MTDFLSALRTYLLSQAAVLNMFVDSSGARTIAQVYVLGIPSSEDFVKAMPQKCIVLVPTGGPAQQGLRPVSNANVDAVCYGESDWEAARLERVVAESLKTLCREVVGAVLLHGCTLSGGPIQARDPETLWPAMRRQFTIRADEREIGTS